MANHKASQPSTTTPRFFYGYIVVAVAFLIMVAMYGVYYSFGIFFKPMIVEFGWTRAMISGAVSLSWILNGLLAIAMGGLNDRFGPRIVVTLCGFLSGLGYLLMSQVGSVWHLYIFYGAIIGIGSSVFTPLASTIARWFIKRRSMMTGIVVAGIGMGALVVPPVANKLISTYDWRTSFIILGGIILVVIVLAAQFLRRDPYQIGQMAYGENENREEGLNLEAEAFSLKEAVCTRQFWIVFTMFLCFGLCLVAVQVHIVPYATDLGITATSAASILATIGGASIAGRILLGSTGDRIGNKQAFIIGFALMAIALLWLISANEAWRLYLFAVLFGLGYGDCATQQSPLIAMLFGIKSHGLIMGVTETGFTIGAAVGPLMAGFIFDITGSYHLAFLIFATIGVTGLILSIFLPTKRTKPI